MRNLPSFSSDWAAVQGRAWDSVMNRYTSHHRGLRLRFPIYERGARKSFWCSAHLGMWQVCERGNPCGLVVCMRGTKMLRVLTWSQSKHPKLICMSKTERNLSWALLKAAECSYRGQCKLPTPSPTLVKACQTESSAVYLPLTLAVFSGSRSSWALVLSDDANLCYPVWINFLLYFIFSFMREDTYKRKNI